MKNFHSEPAPTYVKPWQEKRSNRETEKQTEAASIGYDGGLPLRISDGRTPGSDGASLLDTCKHLFSESGENGETDSELQKRENRRRKSGAVAAKLRRVGLTKRADKMDACGLSWHRASCTRCGIEQTFSTALHCNDRLCPGCASRRAGRLSGRWKRALDAFQMQQAGCHAYFLTLTFKDTDRLQSFATYTKPRRLLFRHPFWKQFGLIGGISAFETKIGKNSGGWHSHWHCVLFTKQPIELIESGSHAGEFQNAVNQEISDLWQTLTGDSIVVKGQTFDGNTRELVKYLTKAGEEMPDERLAELARWAKGKRFISTFGACFNNPVMRSAMNEEEEQENGKLHRCECGCEDFELTAFRWDEKLNRFVVSDVGMVHLGESPPGEKT